MHIIWWQIVLEISGVLALATAFFSLFSFFGDLPDKQIATELPDINSYDFINAIAHLSNSPIKSGEKVIVLKNGHEFIPSLIEALREAKYSVNFGVYIWENGKMSDMIMAELFKCLHKGVEVRILLDAFGGFLRPEKKFERLISAGAIVRAFRPAKFGFLIRFLKRNHRRVIVIDGKIGFTGGMAVSDKWLGDAENKESWRDTMFRVTGEMAKSLQSGFSEVWAGTRGEIFVGKKYYPDIEPKQIYSKYVSLISSPVVDTAPLSKFFWLSLASAKSSIFLSSSYVVPDKHIRKILIERAKAGVDVRMLLPSGKTDAKPIREASHFYFQKFMEAKIKIYEYQPTMMHSKILTIDGVWSIIGSANMDIRSVLMNEENVIGIQDSVLTQELDAIFFEDISHSKEILLSNWKKRSFFRKLVESFFVIFVKQY